jgi:hypothetical protein
MGEALKTADAVLALLQGVWFPTQMSADGRLLATYEPSFPAPRSPWLLTVVGDTWHVTSNAEYWATGGRLREMAEAGRMTFLYPPLPSEIDTHFAFRLDGDELLLQSGGFPWSGPRDAAAATRYVRVAAVPTPAMAALIECVVRSWVWHPGRAEGGYQDRR